MNKSKRKETFTIQGEWFPETIPGKNPDETALDTEMRLFCSCMRWAFNRLLEGKPRAELKKQGQALFGLNSRYTDDAILKAQAIIDSQKELLPVEIRETEQKLKRTEKKLVHTEKKLAKATDSAKTEKLRLTISGRCQRVKKLSGKLATLESHQEAGTIPTVIFGGRTLWRKVTKGRATREEWRNARRNRLYSRGDKTKQGNPQLRLAYQDGEFGLSVTLSHLAESGRRAPRITGKLWLPSKYQLKIWEILLSGAPYTIELIKKDNRYRAYITFDLEQPALVTSLRNGYLGVDTNPDGIALASIDYFGQPEPWPKGFAISRPEALHKFDGEFQVTVHPNGFLYIKIPELAYSRGHRRAYLIGVLAQAVVNIAEQLGKPIALEKLNFGKGRLDTGKKFNRMAANFPHAKLIEAVIRRAYKQGVGIKPVSAVHTSTIGRWKYEQRYGVTTHQAAALVIARRAVGFRERVTREIKQRVAAINAAKSKAESLPGEGTGTARKVKQLFDRLDKKLPAHNDLERWQQQSFNSVWRDLKLLSRLSPVSR